MSSIPVPPWRRARRERPQREAERKPPLSRESIVETALAIIDEGGLEQLSMRRVAQQLDTGPASLYAHVVNKEDLLELVLERVHSELRPEQGDPLRWEDQLKDSVRQVRDAYRKHRDLARAVSGRVPTDEYALAMSDSWLSILRAGGIPDQVAAWTVDLLALYATATAFEDGLQAGLQADTGEPPEEYYQGLHAYMAALPADRFPNLVSMTGALTQGDGEERFDFAMDVFILGIQVYAERELHSPGGEASGEGPAGEQSSGGSASTEPPESSPAAKDRPTRRR